MRKLSYPPTSDQGVDEFSAQSPVALDDIEVEPPFDDSIPEYLFHAEPPEVRGGGVTPKQTQGGKRKRSSKRRVLILLLVAFVGVVVLGKTDLLIAGQVALLTWLSLFAVIALTYVVYRLCTFGLSLLGLSLKTARRLLLPAVLLFVGIYGWRVAPWLPWVDSEIDEAASRKLSHVAPHFVYYSSEGQPVYSEGVRLVGDEESWKSFLRPAIIVIEDIRHAERLTPIDPWSVLRAAYTNATTEKREGASTLQIQIVDLLFEDLGNPWLNKVYEWLLALRIDARMPDRATQLATYCNLVPGDGDARGAAALAADLFNVSDLRQLTPEQAATIAAGLKGFDYSPRGDRQKARERRNLVLKKMREHGDLDEGQYNAAVASELRVENRFKPFEFFVRAAQAENPGVFEELARRQPGARQEGMIERINARNNVTPVVVVRLSLDMGLQRIAERRVAAPVREMRRRGQLPPGTELAFVVIENKTGRVRAVIPALSGQLDISRSSARDPGSTGKPLLAAAALSRGAILPGEGFEDSGPLEFGGSLIHNYGDNYTGRRLTIAECIARSSNVCLMQVQQRLSRAEWGAEITALGLPEPRSFAKIGIGDDWHVPVLRLAAAYTALPNGGEMAAPSYVNSGETTDGAVVEAPVARRRVFNAAACAVVLEGMKACLTSGTGRAAADLAGVARGKTGTTRDSLGVLQTAELSMALWVGDRESNRDLRRTGGALALRLLADFAREVRKARPELAPPF